MEEDLSRLRLCSGTLPVGGTSPASFGGTLPKGEGIAACGQPGVEDAAPYKKLKP